jgi:regulator of sigma E protease
MLNIIISIIGVIITILLVVGVHELGHFLVAKWSGVKVLRFSIGFGKALYTCHDKSGTEYVLAAIPLGGYVKMLDEDEADVPSNEKHLAFNRQPIYKKMAIIAAGPIFNLLFAFVIYWVLFVVGFTSVAPIIGKIVPHSVAAEAGLEPQQEILRIDDKYTNSWMSIIVNLLSRAGDNDTLKIAVRNINTDSPKDYRLDLANWHMDKLRPDPLASLGITPYEPIIPNVIGKVITGSPAEKAGLQKDDQIVAINEKPVTDWITMVDRFIAHPEETLHFSVKRHNQIIKLPVTIGASRNIFWQTTGYLGMAPAFDWPKNMLRSNKYGPVTALSHAWQDVELFSNMNFIVFGKMITGKISLESLGGPITIFESAGSALNNGLMPFFSFLAFLSISIGIINIIPIPGLDGGHLLFQVIEFVTRRPMAQRAQLLLYRFGLIALLLLMVQALVNDILRL